MTTVIIPMQPELANYSLRAILGGMEFLLTFQWNARADLWFMDIADSLAVPLVSGVAMTLGTPLLRNYTDSRRPRGDFVVFDTSGQKLDAGEKDFGDRVQLLFTDFADD